jgi:hypothetical protein
VALGADTAKRGAIAGMSGRWRATLIHTTGRLTASVSLRMGTTRPLSKGGESQEGVGGKSRRFLDEPQDHGVPSHVRDQRPRYQSHSFSMADMMNRVYSGDRDAKDSVYIGSTFKSEICPNCTSRNRCDSLTWHPN